MQQLRGILGNQQDFSDGTFAEERQLILSGHNFLQ
jgi:hypothetical protein